MFRGVTLLSLLFFFVCALAWSAFVCIVRPSDIAFYKKMLREQEAASKSQALSSCAYQTRQGVRKDIWATQDDGSRLHYLIESDSSLLSMHVKQNHFDIVENLEKIHCWMQDKLYFTNEKRPMQQVRFFEADQGTYYYSSQKFAAQSVALSLSRLGGHDLKDFDHQNAFVRGIAEDVTFCISGKNPQFQAQNFKAHFTPSKGKGA
jgi:hypothetical protein